MLTPVQLDQLVQSIQQLSRGAMLHRITTIHARFPVDLTRDFLERQSDERLRHILLALCLHSDEIPELAAAA